MFHLPFIKQIRNIYIMYIYIYIYTYNHKIHFNVHNVFHSLNSHQHVSAVIAAIFRVMLLLQQYKGTNVVSCVSVTITIS